MFYLKGIKLRDIKFREFRGFWPFSRNVLAETWLPRNFHPAKFKNINTNCKIDVKIKKLGEKWIASAKFSSREMYFSDQSTAKFAKFYVPRNFMSRSFMPLR